jgi:endonuclease/exonuclease/phosphatase family metal-dependent hydrolase
VRLGTYNLLHGVPVLGADPGGASAADPALLRDVIASLDADVLGMQEVDVHQPRSGGVHQVAVAAAALGASVWRFAPSLYGTPGGRDRSWTPASEDALDSNAERPDEGPRYGVGLVSRLPVLSWRTTTFAAAPLWLPLLVPGDPRPRLVPVADEPRAAIAAVVEGPAGPMTVATVHLSFVPGWNVRQLRALVRWLADLPRPLVLLGDLNLPGGLPARITGWRRLARAATYPVMSPRVQLDHVLADGLAGAARATVHRLPVSDHAALTVDLPT